MLKIVADENIPYVHDFFDSVGSVETMPGRSMGASDVAQADILLVRSVTPVNKGLLQNSRVKFVGTCTIGVDHLDDAYLMQQGIRYASAPGCNAGGVLQYVITAASHLLPNWQQKSFGVIGNGNVGRRLCQALLALGIDCKAYDPFLSRDTVSSKTYSYLTDLDEVLQQDVICLHAPYTTDGPFPTHHLLNELILRKLKPGALLLNGGRGGVIDNHALLKHMQLHPQLKVVLDVWEGEPQVLMDLLKKVDIATPHIAGYSFEGRIMGTAMIYSALAEFLGMDEDETNTKREQLLLKIFGEKKLITHSSLNQNVASTYDVMADHTRMLEALFSVEVNQRGQKFDWLRKTYPIRHEFSQHCISMSHPEAPLHQALEFGLTE